MDLIWRIFVQLIVIGLTWTCAKLNIPGGDTATEATVIASIIGTAALWALGHWAPSLLKAITAKKDITPPVIALLCLLPLVPLGGCTTTQTTEQAAAQSRANAIWLINFVAINVGQQATYQAGVYLDNQHKAGKIDQAAYDAGKASLKIASDAIATSYANLAAGRPWSQADTNAVQQAFAPVIVAMANEELKAKGLAPILLPPIPTSGGPG
jgi:hypothetical protein